MALPTLEKTWQFNVNQSIGTNSSAEADCDDLLLKIKNSLLGFGSSPWVVWGSCDGSGGGSGVGFGNNDYVDRWVDATDIVHAAAASNHSWTVLEQSGLSNAQICIDMSNSNVYAGTITFSPAGQFGAPGSGGTGADGTATARPTAGDSITLINNTNWGGTSAGFYGKLYVMMSSDGQCTRIIQLRGNAAPMFWGIEKAKSPISAWTNPIFAWATGNTGSIDYPAYNYFNDVSTYPQTKIGSDTVNLFVTSEGWGSGMSGENITVPDDDTGEWVLCPMGLASTTTSHRGPRKGLVYDLWWGNVTLNTGDTYPNNTTRSLVQIVDMVFPWNGSIPLIG